MDLEGAPETRGAERPQRRHAHLRHFIGLQRKEGVAEQGRAAVEREPDRKSGRRRTERHIPDLHIVDPLRAGDFNGNLTREYWKEALDVNFWRNVLKSSSAATPSNTENTRAAHRQNTYRIAFIIYLDK